MRNAKKKLHLSEPPGLQELRGKSSAFFNGFERFRGLADGTLEKVVERVQKRGDRILRVLVEPCGDGEDAYSLAMFLLFLLERSAPAMSLQLVGVDPDPARVQFASAGIYPRSSALSIPASYLEQHWEEKFEASVTAKGVLKESCAFLTEAPTGWTFDLALESGGVKAAVPVGSDCPGTPLKVLCVDDSEIMHRVLSRLLAEKHGFQIVAFACDGREAARLLRSHPTDLITLDINMPGQGGLEFLQEHLSATRPPVVMLSSLDPADPVELSVARQALQSGAADFVVKPELSNMAARGNELRCKLWHAAFKRLGRARPASR